MFDLLTLATEGGVPAEHVAANLAIPIALVIFVGAVYALVWSNYGAKKGALIYSVAFFGFTMMLGVFWWFGAPGTPVATGLQNFPGQAPDAYQGKWFEFEADSELANEFFGEAADGDVDAFQTAAAFSGGETAADFDGDPAYNALAGDLTSGSNEMVNLALRVDEDGRVGIGGEARTAYQEAADAGLAEMGVSDAQPAEPFYTAIVAEDSEILVTEANGVRLAAADITTFANYTSEAAGAVAVPVNSEVFYAFKDPGALWWPSAVWTFLSLFLFLGSLFFLDRIEQREKEALEEISEPERLAVPISQ